MSVVSSQKSEIRVTAVGGLWSAVALAGLLVAGLGLRLWRLDVIFWYDEVFSAWLAKLPFLRLLEATGGDVHPPGYYLLLWAINRLVGDSTEALLRLPSVGAGVLLIYGVYRLSTLLHLDKKTVWLATVITAFSPFQVYYSQEARPYALLMLAITGAAVGLLERRWWLAVAGSLAALYLNNLAPIFLAVLWYAAFTYHVSHFSLELKRFFRAGVITAIGYLPGGIFALHQAGQVGAGYWIPPVTSPGRLLATLDDLLWFTPNNPFILATGLITALVVILIACDTFKRSNVQTFILLVVTISLALVTLISLLWHPVLISRAVAPVAPFFYILLAGAVTRTQKRLVTFGLLAGPTALLILAGPILPGETGRPAGDYELLNLYGEYQPGDGMYHANVGSYVIWRYYRPEMTQYLWPQETTIKETLSGVTRRAMGMDEVSFEAVKCSGPRRWWLINFNSPVTNQVEINYVDNLVSHNPSKKIALLRQDMTVEAWLYLIEPVCVER